MAIPTQKAVGIDQFLTQVTGNSRLTSVYNNVCNICRGPAKEFRDKLSMKEYTISGMCQKCQDSVFKPDEDA